MLLRRYCITLLFFLIWQTSTAKQPTSKNKISDISSVADLAQYLGNKLFLKKHSKWLFNLFDTSPQTQASQKKLFTDLYLSYFEKATNRAQVYRQKEKFAEVFRWRYAPGIVYSRAENSIILDQLGFKLKNNIIFYQLLTIYQGKCSSFFNTTGVYAKANGLRNSSDTVDTKVTTKKQLPVKFNWHFSKLALFITMHSNSNKWCHILENKLRYSHGLRYSITYRIPNIKQTGLTGELHHLHTPKKSINRLRMYRDFSDKETHAGQVAIKKTSKIKWRVLDNNIAPQKTSFSFHHQSIWLGTMYVIGSDSDHNQIRLFVTAKVAKQHFTHRPTVSKSINRYFHNYVFGAGSLGFSSKKYHKDWLVNKIDNTENILHSSKINLIWGYQFGEFINRPYLRLDIAQERTIQKLGYLHGAAYIGGYYCKKAIEQGIVQLRLDYCTPRFEIGNQWLKQFIRLNYLNGYNMLTGELISTHLSKVPAYLKDPFLGGTQRLHLDLETVLLGPRYTSGLQINTLGFLEVVRLQDAQGRIRQSSFCKALGVGLRCTHPRFFSGVLQIKLGYSPIAQNKYAAVNLIVDTSKDLSISEPKTISFKEY